MLQVILNWILAVINCKDAGKMLEFTGIVCLYAFVFCLFFGVLLCSYQLTGGVVLLVVGAVMFVCSVLFASLGK